MCKDGAEFDATFTVLATVVFVSLSAYVAHSNPVHWVWGNRLAKTSAQGNAMGFNTGAFFGSDGVRYHSSHPPRNI